MNDDQSRLVPASSAAAQNAARQTLGSRQRARISTNPRSVTANIHANFARQLAARNQTHGQQHPSKKLKTSAPKGTRLADGYVDRAKQRRADEDRTRQIDALEEALRNGEIDQATFERQRSEIAGGELAGTHLVKGLDFKLLERMRRGEDVYDTTPQPHESRTKEAGGGENEGDDNDNDNSGEGELDQLEEREVTARSKTAEKKKGQLSTVAAAGTKRTRNQILAELKASREARAKAAATRPEPTLGKRFRKIGGTQHKPGTKWVERDSKGREVAVEVDDDGNERRTVKGQDRNDAGEAEKVHAEMVKVDEKAEVLGMEVPEAYRKMQEQEKAAADGEDGDDIFTGAGDDYDPLAGLDDDEDGGDGSSEDESGQAPESKESEKVAPAKPEKKKTDYFKDSKTGLLSADILRRPTMGDPAVLAAVRKAASLGEGGTGERPSAGSGSLGEEEGDSEEERQRQQRRERHRRMLESVDRDAEDMDMGFGTSRLADEDEEGEGVRLSRWGAGEGVDREGEGGGGDGKKRKRGPRKRKGDGDNVADVMRAMERNRGG